MLNRRFLAVKHPNNFMPRDSSPLEEHQWLRMTCDPPRPSLNYQLGDNFKDFKKGLGLLVDFA
jgi:hypothetical protein